jgi:hypothetical protein
MTAAATPGMRPEDWIALAGVVATGAIALASLAVAEMRSRRDRRREQARRADETRTKAAHELALDRAHRRLVPRTQHDLGCTFHRTVEGTWIAEIILTVQNVGLARRNFSRLRFRLRGLAEGEQPKPFRGGPGVAFEHRLGEVELIEQGHYFYVDAGATQRFATTVLVPEGTALLLVHVLMTAAISDELEQQPSAAQPRYDLDLTEERLFAVRERHD